MNGDNTDRTFSASRLLHATPAAVFQAFENPQTLGRWWGPEGFTTTFHEFDFRPDGQWRFDMHAPDGTEIPNPGVILEVIENKRLVTSDAYTEAWKPFVTLDLNFEDIGGKTSYTAIARHWTAADREAHEAMGFHKGWGVATDQLAELASRI